MTIYREYTEHLQSLLFTCKFLLILKETCIFSKESVKNNTWSNLYLVFNV